MLGATFVVSGVTIVSVWWLLHVAHVDSPTDRASLRIDAIRTGLAVGAGVAGAVALALTFRRQWHQEIVASDAQHDASERRIIDAYTKAADQLGSDKATVRLAGLYALERLAENHVDHRQTIVNLICAYLRMPYSLYTRTGLSTAATQVGSPEHSNAVLAEEWQVRIAAQRVLTKHVRPLVWSDGEWRDPNPEFWPRMNIDLTGATLINFDFFGVAVGEALFRFADFHGDAGFSQCTFNKSAWFDHATFHDDARFIGTQFSEAAGFSQVHFTSNVAFAQAIFSDVVWFDDTEFGGPVDCAGARIIKPRFVSSWPVGWTVEPHEDGGLRLVVLLEGGS